MRTIHVLASAILSIFFVVPVASAEMTSICTPPTPPVGACVSVTLGSWTIYYADPNFGPGYHYTCDPYTLVCVLTPDVTYTYRSATVPWVDTSGTYVWCDICIVDAGATTLLP